MKRDFVVVTEHYGYSNHGVFVVYDFSRKHGAIAAFKEESQARRECRYLEKLNYGRSGNGN